jgi:hypothetical protein
LMEVPPGGTHPWGPRAFPKPGKEVGDPANSASLCSTLLNRRHGHWKPLVMCSSRPCMISYERKCV